MEISASQFKARCLKLMDEVAASGRPLTITKHGKPVAKLAPATASPKPLFAADAGQIEITGDIVSPLPARWNAAQ